MDVYPVTLTLPDGTAHQKAKARIDGAGVTVWVRDDATRTGTVVYSSPDVVEESPRRWVSGDVVVAKEAGCGCSGGWFKRWRPPAGNVAVAG